MKLKQKIKDQGTFLKYLVSYIIVFSLPVLFILFYFYPQSSKIIRQNAIDNSNMMLMQTKNNINLQMKNIWSYPDAIHKNESLNQLFSTDNSMNTYIIMQEMKKTLGYNSFVEKAILYNKKLGTFYSFPGSYSKEGFNQVDSTFYYPNWQKAELLHELNELKETTIRPADLVILKGRWNSSFNAITIMMPIPFKNIYSYAVLLLVIPEERLFAYKNQSNDPHNIVMFDKSDQLLAVSNNKLNIDKKELTKIVNSNNKDFLVEIIVDGENYLVNVKHSNLYGLKFVSLISLKEILKEINELKWVTALIVFFIILIETFIILFFMRTNYAPIRRLRERAIASVDSVPLSGMNEFQLVSFAFDNLQSENKELVSKVMINKNISKEYFLIQYLNGILSGVEDMIQHAADFGVTLKENVCCLTFYASDRNIIQLLTSLKEMVDLSGEVNGYCYMVKGMRHEDFILILSYSDEEDIKPYFYKLYEMENDIKIGIGTFESNKMLTNSYTISLTALEMAIFSSNNVAGYEDIDMKNSEELRQLFEILRGIEVTIARKDVRQFNEHLSNLIILMKTKVRGLFILRVIYLQTHNLLAKELNQHGHKQEYCYALSERELSVHYIEGKLKVMGEKITELLMLSNAKKEIAIKDVLQYIDQHYSNPDTSLQKLSALFDMSYSNFSHFFKRNAGENFSSYLETVRIKEAKKLLKETSETIIAISEKVGYLNANSFSRSFKKLENITPGEYRKIYRKN